MKAWRIFDHSPPYYGVKDFGTVGPGMAQASHGSFSKLLSSSIRIPASHSMETALIKIIDAILQLLDSGLAVVLVVLDIFAAFDTVNQQILLKWLDCELGYVKCSNNGSNHTHLIDRSSFKLDLPRRQFPLPHLESHRAQSLGRSFSRVCCATWTSNRKLREWLPLTILSYTKPLPYHSVAVSTTVNNVPSTCNCGFGTKTCF